MSLWIVASIVAAAAQALRFMLQKTLSLQGISATGATFARFAFSAPILVVVLGVLLLSTGGSVPGLAPVFWAYAIVGCLSQICATIFVVMLFQERHFAVGVTLIKAEVIFTVALGLVLLGDRISWLAFGAIALGVVGLWVLSAKPEDRLGWGAFKSRSALLGIGAGALFAVSAVTFRGATLAVDAEPLMRAATTLAVATSLQMAVLALWLWRRSPGEAGRVFASWRRALPLGLASLLGSFCWFFAFTLQTAGLVKAVGQIEIIFVLILGAMVFGERVTRREIYGMGLLAASILALVLRA